uniref:Reverse transcriptase domain-containing protein n=1 Tax=Cannabis sativa TaxID=3483 RepID=A0A803QSU0_CANSA
TKDTIEVPIDPVDNSKVLKIGSKLTFQQREKLRTFLRQNLEVFAWKHSDMVGISPQVMCHRLNIDPEVRGVQQKRHNMDHARYQALKEEVDCLLACGFIRESFYPDWLANPVLVPKPNGSWRTCVDFTDLNKACPKDSFPLPSIDQLVDATAGHELLSFMDAYSGYNQIPMYEPDQEHTSFITDRCLYCYKVMPFGLINASATYQRLVNMMFADLLGDTMEVYVDDML